MSRDVNSIAFSLNAPVPGNVLKIASALREPLAAFDFIRERHTLVVKRLGEGCHDRLEKRARRSLAGSPAVAARVAGIGVFYEPAAGTAPVVYLSVESPGLHELHHRLCESFDPIPGIEGEDYVPHITLARGGGAEAREVAARMVNRSIDPVTWTVNELLVWDARHGEPTGRITLPA